LRRDWREAVDQPQYGTASPREAYAWMEYLTYAGDTTMANLRRKNGRAEPYRVDFWGVGNECWDCGGKFTPDEYAESYRRFESAIPRFKDVPRQLILCGPDGNKPHEREVWTDTVLRELYQWRIPAVHALDAHFYVWGDPKGTGTSGSFNDDQFSGMLWRAREIEPVMLRQWEILQSFDKRIQLFVGEWGPWHADAFGNRFWQRVTMRDAVLISLTLDIFTNHADKIRAATYTQLCNILGSPFQTLDDVAYSTPVYHAFRLHKPHRGREVVKSTAMANPVRFKAPEGHMLENPGFSACVTRGERDLYVTVSNLHPGENVELSLLPPSGARFGEATAEILSHEDPQSFNDPAQPERVKTVSHPITATAGHLVIHLPPASVAGIRVFLT
jgi:alpha-L-arabinofuranosidase